MKNRIIENFVGAWNNEDNSERHRLLQLSFAEDGHYSDEFATKKIKSLNELHFFINNYRENTSKNINLTGEPKFNQDTFRFNVEIENLTNEKIKSTFFGEFEKDRIKSIIGFIDE